MVGDNITDSFADSRMKCHRDPLLKIAVNEVAARVSSAVSVDNFGDIR